MSLMLLPGEQLLRLPQGIGQLLLCNTSRDSKRIFVLKIAADAPPQISVHFLAAGETSEAFDTGNNNIEDPKATRTAEVSWKSGDGSSVLFGNGIIAYSDGEEGWRRFNLHHHFAYKKMHSTDVYKVASPAPHHPGRRLAHDDRR